MNRTKNITADNISGCPDSLVYMHEDWNTVAFKVVRDDIGKCQGLTAMQYNSIYFLVGIKDDKWMAYVGQAGKRATGEAVRQRLMEHDASLVERYADIWSEAIILTSKDDSWDSDALNALETAFFDEIEQSRCLNGARPSPKGANMDRYVEKIRQIKTYIGVMQFDFLRSPENISDIQVVDCSQEAVESRGHDDRFSGKMSSEQIQSAKEQAVDNICMLSSKTKKKLKAKLRQEDKVKPEDLHNGSSGIPEIVTPPEAVVELIDTFPKYIWNPNTKFLDPACKGGECLKEVYNRLMQSPYMIDAFPDEHQRSLHILDNQLYGIAVSKVSRDRTSKALYGHEDNILEVHDYIELIKGKADAWYFERVLKERLKDMKFDVVLGNPPYQETTGGGNGDLGGRSIYQYFIDLAFDLDAKHICMIVKDNWMQAGQIQKTRERMIKQGISRIKHYPVLGEMFSGVNVATSIFYINKDNNGMTHYTSYKGGVATSDYTESIKDMPFVPSSTEEIQIIKKVVSDANKNPFNVTISGAYPFGINSAGNFSGSGGHIGESNERTEQYNIPIMYMISGEPYFMYTNKENILRRQELLPCYKIVSGLVLHDNSSVITNIRGLKPGEICAGSYTVLYYSMDQTEASNAYKYILTKFLRFLVCCMTDKMSTAAQDRFKLVPNQNFTDTSDIDWSASVADIDKQLYKKYELTPEEIDYIEKTIKYL